MELIKGQGYKLTTKTPYSLELEYGVEPIQNDIASGHLYASYVQ
jgi:hypothetical protein